MMWNRPRPWCLLLLVLLLPVAHARAGDAPTAEQVQAAAERIDLALQEGDASVYEQFFSNERFLDRILGSVKLEPVERQNILKNMPMGATLGKQFAGIIEADGSYRLLRVREVDGRPRALFRTVPTDGGINYHDTVFELDAHGTPVIVDIDIYMTGELLSQTVRRTILPIVVDAKRSRLEKLVRRESLFVTHGDAVQALLITARSGDPHDALDQYSQLPAELQEDLLVMMSALLAAQRLGVDTPQYNALSERFMKTHGRGNNAELVRIDPLITLGKRREVIQMFRRLDRRVGGDPYLSALIAYQLAELGEHAEAKKLIEAAIAADPDFEDMYWVAIDVSILSDDHATTLRHMIVLHDRFGMRFAEDLSAVEAYRAFTASPQHEQWQQHLAETEGTD